MKIVTSFAKTNRTELRAVPTNHAECAEKGKKCLKQAEDVGARTSGRNARHQENQCIMSYPNASELQTKQEIKLTLQAAEYFRVAGEHHWVDSANAYALAAALHAESMRDPNMAAELFTEAAIVIEKVDCDFANEFYRKAISQHCDASHYNEAAILEERLATNHNKKENFEVSIEEYRRASKLYAAAGKHDSADRTLDRTAYLLGKIGWVRDSAYAYQKYAIGQSSQDIKKFNVPRIMLRAGVLLLSDCLRKSPEELDFGEIRKMMEDVYKQDCRFEASPEHRFLVDMMHSVAHGDSDKFADCLYSFNSLSEFDDLILDALQGIRNAVGERAMASKEEE
mmetsp:Transcript_13657/g.29335  ORF Transcript_13657/g.29335 Transcript_13657/m.29335 type:complete len:339 (-) Transcript_13657:46-1062(-)